MDKQGMFDHIKNFEEIIREFEKFFARVGFKKIDGAVFGLLSLSETPLKSEEIEQILNLSQPAVSNALKNLNQYSMIGTKDHPENKRVKIHFAKENAISIVSGVLKKRELSYLEDFEKISKKALTEDIPDKVQSRFTHILSTTQFAKSLTEVIIKIDQEFENPYPIINNIPKAINFIKDNQKVGLEQIKNTQKAFKHIAKRGLNNILDKMENH